MVEIVETHLVSGGGGFESQKKADSDKSGPYLSSLAMAKFPC